MSPPTSPVNPAIGSLESRNSPDAASHNDGGNGGEIIESLGVALAGVTIGNSSGNATTAGTSDTNIANDSNTGTNGANGSLFHGGSDAPSPFSAMGANTNNESADIGWASTFSDASKSAFSGSNAAATGAPAPPPVHHQQQQQLHHHQEAHVMKESLDLFLSQSPSQTLGNDVFKLSSTNLAGLALPGEGELPSNRDSSPFHFNNNGGAGATGLATGANPSVFGGHELRQPATSVPTSRSRRTDSPSVTGTTASSRSASPYTNSANQGSIPAFRYDNAGRPVGGNAGDLLVHRQASYGGEGDRQNNQVQNLTHGFNSHPNIPSLDSTVQQQRFGGQQGISGGSAGGGAGGGSSRNLFGSGLGSTSPYEQDRSFAPPLNDQTVTQQQLSTGSPQPHQQQQQPQPQVLYMAVPTPDGRGQVLQPVQMVQVQGKGFTYVVPQGVNQGAVAGAAMNGNMAMLPPMTNLENGSAIMGNEQRNPIGDNRSKNYALDGLKQDEYGGMPRGGGGGGKFVAGGQQNDPSAALYGTTQRPPLDALLGQVRRLSRDQVGCRLVQQALDEEGPMAATMILNEGLPFWSEAMVDPFGNYLFQKILEKITAEERIMLVKTVSSRLVNASLNLHGTRSVQKIVELCAADEHSGFQSETSDESAADILTRSLFPAAARLCIDSHGNHVIQRILLKLGPRHTKFVFDAVAASVGDVARHRHGCCVIQRCLDSPISESRSHLVNRIVEKSLELMQDAYGNYVVQYVLDVCSDDDVHAVCESVIGKVNLLAIQKFSSNVMEKCLERCTDSVKEMYMQELSDTDRVRELMMDPFGNYVVQRALSVATHSQAIRLVEAMRPHLVSGQPGFPNGQRSGGVRNTAGGRRIMAKICRRFPNFTLSAGGSQEDLFSQSKPQQRHMGNNFGGQGHHGQAAYGNPMSAGLMAGNHNHMSGNPMQAPPRMQHYNDPGAVAGPHLIMNQQQAYYDSGSVNVGYFDHNFNDHPFGGQGFSQQNYGGHNGFPNM